MMWWPHFHWVEPNMGIMYTNSGPYRKCRCGAKQWGEFDYDSIYWYWKWEKP